MNPPIELCFNVRGSTMPVDNGYPLYAAISKVLGEHLPPNISVVPFNSKTKAGNTLIYQNGFLRIRTPEEHVRQLLDLSGKTLQVEGHICLVGAPRLFVVQPTSRLYSPYVTFKNSTTEERFLSVVARELDEMGIEAKASVPINKRGLPERKIRCIRNVKIVGFGLQLDDLSLDDSTVLLNTGLGGRRHLGGGIFFSRTA